MDEVLALVAESLAEALLDLGKDVVEVGADKGIDGAFDGGEEEAVLAAANSGGVVIRELDTLTKLAIFILQFHDEAAEVILNLTRRSVARGSVTRV